MKEIRESSSNSDFAFYSMSWTSMQLRKLSLSFLLKQEQQFPILLRGHENYYSLTPSVIFLIWRVMGFSSMLRSPKPRPLSALATDWSPITPEVTHSYSTWFHLKVFGKCNRKSKGHTGGQKKVFYAQSCHCLSYDLQQVTSSIRIIKGWDPNLRFSVDLRIPMSPFSLDKWL